MRFLFESVVKLLKPFCIIAIHTSSALAFIVLQIYNGNICTMLNRQSHTYNLQNEPFKIDV